jgi:hypothetical protein
MKRRLDTFADIKAKGANTVRVVLSGGRPTADSAPLTSRMYAVFNTAAAISSYLDTVESRGWPLVTGEFGRQVGAGEVDGQTLMAEADARRLGCLGWSRANRHPARRHAPDQRAEHPARDGWMRGRVLGPGSGRAGSRGRCGRPPAARPSACSDRGRAVTAYRW